MRRFGSIALLALLVGPDCVEIERHPRDNPHDREASAGGSGCAGEGPARPRVLGVEPASRTVDGRTAVEIIGRGFHANLRMDPSGDGELDAAFHAELLRTTEPGGAARIALDDVRFDDSRRVSAVVPAGLAPGRYAVRVTTPTGAQAELGEAFTNALAPEVQAVDPPQAVADGGAWVTVYGRHFVPGSSVSLGGCDTGAEGTELAGQRLESAEEIRGKVPPTMAAGVVDIVVTSEFGRGCLSRAFEVLPGDEQPAVLAVEPPFGPLGGGTRIVIRVEHLAADSQASIGGQRLGDPLVDEAAGTIAGTLPPGEQAGRVDVTVAVRGLLPAVLSEGFEYVGPPEVGLVSPGSGPQDGGTLVEVAGEGFLGEVEVELDGLLASDVEVLGRDLLRARTPSGRGMATVLVRAAGGEGQREDAFSWLPPPTLSAIDPEEGPVAGGIPLRVGGSGLDAEGAEVYVGEAEVARSDEDPVAAGVFHGTAPAGEGRRSVVVESSLGVAYRPGAFAYRASPTIESIRPQRGHPGDLVEIVGSGFVPGADVRLGGSALGEVELEPGRIRGRVPDGQGLSAITVLHAWGRARLEGAFRYHPARGAPSVGPLGADGEPDGARVHPPRGPEAGGTAFWIHGEDLPDGIEVRFGGASAADVRVVDGVAITGIVPAGRGNVDVEVLTPRPGHAEPGLIVLGRAWVYDSSGPLEVTAIRPTIVPAAGGVEVVVTGTGFRRDAPAGEGGAALAPGTRILVGGRPLVEQRFIHSGEIRGVVPAGAGVHDVVAVERSSAGWPGRAAQLSDALRWAGAGETGVGSVWPGRGPEAGGTLVSIRGVGLDGIRWVRFGAADVPPVAVEGAADALVEVRAPAGAPGVVDVALCRLLVDCPAALSVAGGFEYIVATAPPLVEAVSPDHGPEDAETVVRIVGGPFAEDVAVALNDDLGAGRAVVGWVRTSVAELSVTLPEGAGDADLVVSSESGSAVAVRAYRYLGAPPSVRPLPAGLPSRSGPALPDPADAGQRVRVLGDDFVPGRTRVFVGDVELSEVESAADGTLSGVRPPTEPGVWDVRIETPSGSVTLGQAYTVAAPAGAEPDPVWLEPPGGPPAGGRPVVLRGANLQRLHSAYLDGRGGRDLPLERLVVLSPALAIAATGAPDGPTSPLPLVVRDEDGATRALQSTYTYRVAPALSGVQPAGLRAHPAGGDEVTVRVAGFSDDAVVSVEGLALGAPRLNEAGDLLHGVLPPMAPGPRALRVTNLDGVWTLPAAVEVMARPSVERVEPDTGLAGVATQVVVVGRGFSGPTRVSLGAAEAQVVVPDNDERLQVLATPGVPSTSAWRRSGGARCARTASPPSRSRARAPCCRPSARSGAATW